jgi:hypothetical protein
VHRFVRGHRIVPAVRRAVASLASRTGGTHATRHPIGATPMLGVYEVFEVLSGKLTLPYAVVVK